MKIKYKPAPHWDRDFPGIPWCDSGCPYYDVDVDDHGHPGVECAITTSKEGEIPGLPDQCEECEICLPALALGKECCK